RAGSRPARAIQLSLHRHSDHERFLATAARVAARQLLHPEFSQVGSASENYGVWPLVFVLCALDFGFLRQLKVPSSKYKAQRPKPKDQRSLQLPPVSAV